MADVIQFPTPEPAMQPLEEHLEIAAAMVEAEGLEMRSRIHSLACAMTTEYRRGLEEGRQPGHCRPECNEGWVAAKAAIQERDQLADEAEQMNAALDAAWELSTWTACINWRARDKDNTGEWLDELREKITATQAAIHAARTSDFQPNGGSNE